MCETHGSRLHAELARRGELGTYFTYETHKALQPIDSIGELRSLLNGAGYPTVEASENVVRVADGLREAKKSDDLPYLLTADPTGLLSVIVVPMWHLYRALRPKPQFPTGEEKGS